MPCLFHAREAYAAVGFDLLAHGAVLQAGEDELVVAPNELVRPAGHLATSEVEGVLLQCEVFGLLGAWFVHLFDDLKWQLDVAGLAGLAVPHQLYLAFVVEQEKSIAFGQRGFGFYELEDFAFLGVGELQVYVRADDVCV